MDYLDTLLDNWCNVLLGAIVTALLTVLWAVVLVLLGYGVTNVWTIIATELSVGIGAFVAAKLAGQARAIIGLAAAILSAFVSLLAASLAQSGTITWQQLATLFISYSLMGLIGGYLAGWELASIRREDAMRDILESP